jgi:hypothetical protein
MKSEPGHFGIKSWGFDRNQKITAPASSILNKKLNYVPRLNEGVGGSNH